VSKIEVPPHIVAVLTTSRDLLQERSAVIRVVVPRAKEEAVDLYDESGVLNVGINAVGDQERSDVTVEIEVPVRVAHLREDPDDTGTVVLVVAIVVAIAVAQKRSITTEGDVKDVGRGVDVPCYIELGTLWSLRRVVVEGGVRDGFL